MTKKLTFYKYQGLGNDFIFFEKKDVGDINYSELAIRVCDRHFGIGADGMAVLSKQNDILMEFYNADGSEAPMCGNASRCVADYVVNNSIIKDHKFILETNGGALSMSYNNNNTITAKLSKPLLPPSRIPAISDKENLLNHNINVFNKLYEISILNTMTPHSVIFVDDLDDVDIDKVGSSIENHEMFPKKINVNFIKIINEGYVLQETWERGVGRTLACGTGACASVVAGVLTGRLKSPVEVKMKGGTLTVSYDKVNGLTMTGEVKRIAEGTYYYRD